MLKVFAAIDKYNMIKKGNTIIVALSGGADSMALFHFLFVNRDLLGIVVEAVNIDHCMREKASEQDSEYVRKICEEYGVKLHFKKLDSAEKNKSEEWARNERYAFFDTLVTNDNIRIATAHTASDNAETVLLNLCRGTSLRGAGGIPPCRGAYIRPFIDIQREQTEKYCEENSLKYVTDETNFTSEYARGRVRNNIIPLLNTVHDGASAALARFAQEAREADVYINNEACKALNAAAFSDIERSKRYISSKAYKIDILRLLPNVLQKKALELMLPKNIDVNANMIMKAQELLYKKSGEYEISRKFRLTNLQNAIFIEKIYSEAPNFNMPIKEGNFHVFDDYYLQVELTEYELFLNSSIIQKKDLIFLADYGKINNTGYFRQRKSTDKYTSRQRGVTKTVKKLMNEAGIPRTVREYLPMLVCENEVLWMPNYGFSAGLEIDKDTEKVIYITLKNNMEVT
ncbi:MAG: tRNA lysidine(34) synthetase TilS [Oscillospiraceae bacterium]